MRYKLLGTSGLRVSELCLGAMSFGDAWGFGADEKESHRTLEAVAEAGGNFIDTANKYHEGQSEELVGGFLGPDRDRFVVVTRYTLAMDPGDPNAAGNSRKNLRRSVEASLRRLRTDYLDLPVPRPRPGAGPGRGGPSAGARRSYGHVETRDARYTPTIVDRGADALVAAGRIGETTAAARKAEARRRSTAGQFFGHIAYASLVGRLPN